MKPHALTLQTADDGLQYIDIIPGTGDAAAAGMIVFVNYTGWVAGNEEPFDSCVGRQEFEFLLGAKQVIAGWDQGLVGMKVGGQRLLIIPAALGYGSRNIKGIIPPNSTLVFLVNLVGTCSINQSLAHSALDNTGDAPRHQD